MFDSAGIMYWGDSGLKTIEAAYLNGTGRRILINELSANYYGFALHDDIVYFIDPLQEYVMHAYLQLQ